MCSRDSTYREGRVKEEYIVKLGSLIMVGQDTKTNKDRIIRGAAAMIVDLSKFGTESEKNYREPLREPVCVCSFKKAFSVGKLIDLGDSACPKMYCIKQLSTGQLVYSRVISLYLIITLLTSLVIG